MERALCNIQQRSRISPILGACKEAISTPGAVPKTSRSVRRVASSFRSGRERCVPITFAVRNIDDVFYDAMLHLSLLAKKLDLGDRVP